ncbi:MAG: mediator complex subunit [Alyxoria varia]|nr:MAG: mediator complex subunit [Alyxoria varia]
MSEQHDGETLPESLDDDMADLFGEPQSAIAPAIEPGGPVLDSETLLRLDELSLHGCCQKLAWSEMGAIAHVTDQNHVNIYTHLFDTKKKEYALFGPTRLEMPQTHQHPIAHVSWNPRGAELAVVDKAGVLFVFQPYLAINRLRLQNVFPGIGGSNVAPAPLGSIMGMEWLAPNRKLGYYHTATKTGNTWRYSELLNQPQTGPHQPQGKTAIIWVTMGGNLRLLYKSIDESWQETSIDLIDNADDRGPLLTHAAFAPENDDTYHLATFDVSQSLKLYSIKVQWDSPPGMKQPPPSSRSAPRIFVTKQNKIARNMASENGQALKICHLMVLPAVKEPSTDEEYPLTVIGYCGTSPSRSEMSLGPEVPQSKLITWTFYEEKETLHPVFGQLAQKKKKDPSQLPANTFTKAKSQSFDLAGLPIRVGTHRLNTMLWVAYSDGQFDLLDRNEMQRVSPSDTTDTATNPISAGYEFAVEPCSQFDLSVNAALAVFEDPTGKVQFKYVALACFAMMFATSTAQALGNSHLHAMLGGLVSTFGYERILLELYKCCTGTLPEVIKDDEHSSKTFNVMKSPHMQRCLAVQQMIDHGDDDTFASFGSGGGNNTHNSSTRLNRLRTIPAKSASIMVEVRTIFYAVHIIQSSGTDKAADTVYSLVGIFRWFLHVVSMLLDDLFIVHDRVVSRGGKEALDSAAAVRAAIHEENTPVMAVLLGSTPRALMKLCSYYIRNLLDRNGIKGVISSASSARSFENILRPLFDSAPIRLKDFERLLDEMNHHVRQAYDNAPQPQQPQNAADTNNKKPELGESSDTAPMPDPQRLATERLFLITGDFPDLLFPVAHRLLTHTLERITTPVEEGGYGLDRIKMLQTDMRFLGLTDEPQAVAFQKNNRFDVLRQVSINGLRSWRRCTRCGACMEDLVPGQCPVWMRNLGMKCTCGNPWVVQERKV